MTLVGPLGVGKTRLAVHVARAVLSRGAWMAGLSGLAHQPLVPQVVASALSVREPSGQSVTDALIDHISHDFALLVLDNCEHLLDACAILASTLLASCPHLSILATSRECLQVDGEVPWQVPSLAVPLPGTPLEEVAGNDAVRLFMDRVPLNDFALTEEAAAAVAEICRRLDGLPLAIELAAGRVGPLTPEQIAARLDQRFELLITASHDVPPGHRSLHAALQSSHRVALRD
ncbi:MAG: ATP-binding protein [Acidimicrobiales bacterium]